MTTIQKLFYGWILICALGTAALATAGQYEAEKRLDTVRTILTK